MSRFRPSSQDGAADQSGAQAMFAHNRSAAAPGPQRRGIGFWFWGTILVLIAVTAVLVLLALLRPVPEPAQISFTQEQMNRIDAGAQMAGHKAIADNLDTALDQMFMPVYAGVPAYADFHYSVWGQYVELLAAGRETLGLEEEVGSLLRQHLFDGFETRHAEQITHLHGLYQQAVMDHFGEEAERIEAETGQPLPEAARLAMQDAQQRMMLTVPAAATGSAAANVAVIAIVKPIAKKVVAATAAKAAAKGIGKAGGIGGAATGGAIAGSFFGPVGTVVGGVGGAVVGWLAVDYAVVRLDEYFNRDEFEAELTAAIDEQKALMRDYILNSYQPVTR